MQNTKIKTLVFWIIKAWILLAIFTLLSSIVAWSTKTVLTKTSRLPRMLQEYILFASDLPGLARDVYYEIDVLLANRSRFLLVKKSSTNNLDASFNFPNKGDSGYILYSGLDLEILFASVKLVRVSDGVVMAEWNPDWNLIYKKTSTKDFVNPTVPVKTLAVHPLLMDNGDIIFNTGSSMVRLGYCRGGIKWILDRASHHSNEFDSYGNIWTSGVRKLNSKYNNYLRDNVRIDSVVQISPDGLELYNESFSDILSFNGLGHMLYGQSGMLLNKDPIHLNQITPAFHKSKYWEKGDLLISARNLSTIFIFRPRTNRIVWYKSGPWLNQHSVGFLNDSSIYIFDNNVYSGFSEEEPYVFRGDSNRVLVYDFSSNSVSEPFFQTIRGADIDTHFEGRVQFLKDGSIFVEETERGRMLRLNKYGVIWSFLNIYNNDYVGTLGWSRYIEESEISDTLLFMRSSKCNLIPN